MIKVLSRGEAEQKFFWQTDNVISITDPNKKLAEIKNVENILRLSFYDIDTIITTLDGQIFYPMSEGDADRVVFFVKNISPEDNLYVHCEAGISRSAGIAAAIARFWYADDGEYYFKKYVPNRHCYNLVLKKLIEG